MSLLACRLLKANSRLKSVIMLSHIVDYFRYFVIILDIVVVVNVQLSVQTERRVYKY